MASLDDLFGTSASGPQTYADIAGTGWLGARYPASSMVNVMPNMVTAPTSANGQPLLNARD